MSLHLFFLQPVNPFPSAPALGELTPHYDPCFLLPLLSHLLDSGRTVGHDVCSNYTMIIVNKIDDNNGIIVMLGIQESDEPFIDELKATEAYSVIQNNIRSLG